jgi:hypothetical protein
MCLYVQPLGPAADPWDRDFRTMFGISQVKAAGGVSGVCAGGMGSGRCRACSAWHTSVVGSRMVCASKDHAACEMLPMTRQRWIQSALRYCSGRLVEVGGARWREGLRGRGIRRFQFDVATCRRAWVRQACPLVWVSRAQAGRLSRLSTAALTLAVPASVLAATRPSILQATSAAHCSQTPNGTVWGMQGVGVGVECGGLRAP